MSLPDKQRRKKASRACSHCQKAHLTCDDSRPCQRCEKRGLENTCTDGARKKAKYLQEDDGTDTYLLQQQNTTTAAMPFIGSKSDSNATAASLEYSMISDMILPSTMVDYRSHTNSSTNSLDRWFDQQQVDTNSNTMIMDNSTHTSPSVSSATNTPPAFLPTHITANNTFSNGNEQKIMKRRKGIGATPKEIYDRVQKPYNYVESYHYLINYVKSKMGKHHLIRISRALVLFRPSHMSLIASLTEEDLIFMEKCVQRTLLEFEKLIRFSGTPTVVWRRTGEIILVGKEFLLLTQWTKETLLGKRTCIYELMDNGSAVEYWEKFSQHAFDSAESGICMSVILVNPSYRPVPCSFCFTLKRDIFDLPSIVVGNFLPILGAGS